jgi:hypothetical protein
MEHIPIIWLQVHVDAVSPIKSHPQVEKVNATVPSRMAVYEKGGCCKQYPPSLSRLLLEGPLLQSS